MADEQTAAILYCLPTFLLVMHNRPCMIAAVAPHIHTLVKGDAATEKSTVCGLCIVKANSAYTCSHFKKFVELFSPINLGDVNHSLI